MVQDEAKAEPGAAKAGDIPILPWEQYVQRLRDALPSPGPAAASQAAGEVVGQVYELHSKATRWGVDTVTQLGEAGVVARSQLYSDYLGLCSAAAPTLRQRGKQVGSRLLAGLFDPRAPSSTVHYSDCCVCDARGRDAAPATAPLLAGSSSPAGVLDPLLTPMLDPFVDGLAEPFTELYGQYQRRVLLVLAATALLSGAAGFLLGRSLSKGDSDGS